MLSHSQTPRGRSLKNTTSEPKGMLCFLYQARRQKNRRLLGIADVLYCLMQDICLFARTMTLTFLQGISLLVWMASRPRGGRLPFFQAYLIAHHNWRPVYSSLKGSLRQSLSFKSTALHLESSRSELHEKLKLRGDHRLLYCSS